MALRSSYAPDTTEEVTESQFGVNSIKTMDSVQKKFRNQEFLYGISLFCLCSENRDFLHIKISYFCIFFAEIGVLNTNRTPGVAESPQADVCRSVLIFS